MILPAAVLGPHLSVSLSQTAGMGGVDLAGLLSNPGFMNMVRCDIRTLHDRLNTHIVAVIRPRRDRLNPAPNTF